MKNQTPKYFTAMTDLPLIFLLGLPISGSAKTSTAHSSATPSVDRYAALKDLDDQFREIKFETETNNNNNAHDNSSGTNGNHTGEVRQGKRIIIITLTRL